MSEKHEYQQQQQPQQQAAPPYANAANASQQQGWNPSAQPSANEQLGAYHPSAEGVQQRHVSQPGAKDSMQVPTQPMQVHGGQPGVPNTQGYPTATYCPATGGAHQPVEGFGLVGIIIGILFCPCGLIALCCDKKITCANCRYVIQPGWGQ